MSKRMRNVAGHGITAARVRGLLTLGLSDKAIARAIGIGESTTGYHVCRILRELRVSNRTQAALMLARREP